MTIATNYVSSGDVPKVCVTYEEINTNNLIDETTSVVSSDDNNMNRYELPPQINRAKAPGRHSSDNSKEFKYPIIDYVFNGHLPSSIQGFVNQMSSINYYLYKT